MRLAKLGNPTLGWPVLPPRVSPVPGVAVRKGWDGLLNLLRSQRQREGGEREDMFSLVDACKDAEATLTRDKYSALVRLSKTADDLDEDPDLRSDLSGGLRQCLD